MSAMRTLLLTDVVDSTRLASELGDARMAELWIEHDRLVRDLVEQHGGEEADRTDGFLILFEDVPRAVACAAAIHDALGVLATRHAVEFEARIGVHVGPVIRIETSAEDRARGAKPIEVEGLAKPLAARVMSLARGGQTLLSGAAAARVGEPWVLRSHGQWRLKGIPDRIEIVEVGVKGTSFSPPADRPKAYRVVQTGDLWLPARQIPHRLRSERDAFVGRAADLTALAERFESGARLVSVLGIGGAGKTRLAVRYGWCWLGDYPGGVWFCDLSDARSIDGICAAVGRSLEIALVEDDPVVLLGRAIAEKGPCLVILDNFEQVAAFADGTVGAWLDDAPQARFLVTSREILGLSGETALALPPLGLDAAVQLFAERGAQALRGFALTDGNRQDARDLVELLDRLPLAIELAAARVRVMAPSQLLGRMNQRFRLLTSGARRDRQATLRATLDWSWDLLSSEEQAGLAQLAVFEGGFDLEAAEAVLDVGDVWGGDVVQGLVDKSLVRRVSEERMDLLVSVREYAAERLSELGGRAAAEVRHGEHFATRGDLSVLSDLHRHGGVERRRTLTLDLENYVVACERAIRRGHGPIAAATAQAAWVTLQTTGPFSQAARLLQGAADVPEEPDVPLLLSLGLALRRCSRFDESLEVGERVLAATRERGDSTLEAQAHSALGALHGDRGDVDAWRQHLEAALALCREHGLRVGEGNVAANLGIYYKAQGQPERARELYQTALEIHREVGNRLNEAVVLGNLGNLAAAQGMNEEALATLELALATSREIGHRALSAVVLGNIGRVHLDLGHLDRARRCLEEALSEHREIGNRTHEAELLGSLEQLAEQE